MAQPDQMEVDQGTSQPIPVRSIEGWILLITNLHEETSESDIQDKFADYGAIKNLHLNLDRRTGYVKGYALLEYANKEESDTAITETNGTLLMGQKITVAYAFIEPPPPPAASQKRSQKEEKNMDKDQGIEERGRSRSPERRGSDS